MKVMIPFYKVGLKLFKKQKVGQQEIGKLIWIILMNEFFG
jgi:hypothetical protein